MFFQMVIGIKRQCQTGNGTIDKVGIQMQRKKQKTTDKNKGFYNILFFQTDHSVIKQTNKKGIA